MRAVIPLLTAIVVATLAVAGCGGGKAEPETTDVAALTKEQFKHLAHRICYRLSKKQVRQMQAYGMRHGYDPNTPSKAQREAVNAAVVLPIEEEKIEELGAAHLPRHEEVRLKKVLAAMERGIEQTEAHPGWMAAPTASHPNPFAAAILRSAAFGIWLCAEP